MVLFFHMAPHWALIPELSPLVPLMQRGFVGVDVFFVISGFVVYQSGARSVVACGFVDFLKRRFARIFFNYWPSFLIVSAISIFILETYPKSLKQVIFIFFLLYPKFWDNWIAAAWTLTYELYFYFILGIILITRQIFHGKIIALLAFTIISWHLYWLYDSPTIFYEEKIPLSFILNGFTIEFLSGAGLAIAFNKNKGLFSITWLSITLAFLAAAAGFYVSTLSIFFSRIDILRAGSFGLIAISLVFILISLEESTNNPSRLLSAIGDCSFSIYLLHGILLGALGLIRYRFLENHQTLLLIYSLLIPVVIIALSYTWYALVERKTIELTRKI